MQPGDIHFASLWPAANGGVSRKAIVPFQCSLAEASETLDRLICQREAVTAAISGNEIETLVLGPFCVFSTASASPSALIVVGTKTWTVAPSVVAYIEHVRAELARNGALFITDNFINSPCEIPFAYCNPSSTICTWSRDPVDFGYWQLRSLAWRAEEVFSGENASSHAMPPRLFEGREWDDEEDESWEEDSVRSGLGYDSPSPQAELTMASGGGASVANEIGYFKGLSPSSETRQMISTTAGDTVTLRTGATSLAASEPAVEGWANFNEPATALGAPAASGSSALDPKSPLLDVGSPPESASAQTTRIVAPATEPNHNSLMSGDLLGAPASDSSTVETTGPAPRLEPLTIAQYAATASLTMQPVMGQPAPSVEDTNAVNPVSGRVLTENFAERKVQGYGSKPDASEHGKGAGQQAAGSSGVGTPRAAFSEDLAYVHQGSNLQRYAITGSVLVAASESRAILRLTDQHGHIATATANPSVATETASGPPTREYSCESGSTQALGIARPKYLPAVMYRCSPAVKELPVRVTCRLRTAGTAVFVWVQVVSNPRLVRPLEGVSVMVHLPFACIQEGQVKSEPQATWNAKRRIVEWALQATMSAGDKKVVQARLLVNEEGLRKYATTPTAPAMVKCHLSNFTFSSVELTTSQIKGAGGAEVTGEVVKRCRVQCRQQP